MKSDIGLLYYLNTFNVLLMYMRSIYNPGESTTKLSFNFIFILQDFLVVLLLQLVLPCTFHRASTNIAQAKREQYIVRIKCGNVIRNIIATNCEFVNIIVILLTFL